MKIHGINMHMHADPVNGRGVLLQNLKAGVCSPMICVANLIRSFSVNGNECVDGVLYLM